MSKVVNFEDLIAWQRARKLAGFVYDVTREGEFARDFGLSRQMRRAAVSIMSNIAEGHERGGAAEYARFLGIAKGSCAELRSQLYLALDAAYLDRKTFTKLLERAKELGRILGGLRRAVQERRTST
ncbi:MAG: four helix bundle protein [Planctomycetota bacterium]